LSRAISSSNLTKIENKMAEFWRVKLSENITSAGYISETVKVRKTKFYI